MDDEATQVNQSIEQQHRVEMIRKIKKARDLVFTTTSLRGSRR